MFCEAMLRSGRCVLVSVLILIFSACSGAEQKRLEYRNSQSIAPLQIPAGLHAPQSDGMLVLPQVDSEAAVVDIRPPVNLPEPVPAQ